MLTQLIIQNTLLAQSKPVFLLTVFFFTRWLAGKHNAYLHTHTHLYKSNIFLFSSSVCWIPSADRSLRSVLFYVEPAWGRLCSAMSFKLDVSPSSLLTPTFYLSLRFWTGRGLYLHYGTSNHCIRDFIAFSNLNKICVMSQEYWGLQGIEYRARYMQCLPLIYYASKIGEEDK